MNTRRRGGVLLAPKPGGDDGAAPIEILPPATLCVREAAALQSRAHLADSSATHSLLALHQATRSGEGACKPTGSQLAIPLPRWSVLGVVQSNKGWWPLRLVPMPVNFVAMANHNAVQPSIQGFWLLASAVSLTHRSERGHSASCPPLSLWLAISLLQRAPGSVSSLNHAATGRVSWLH